MTRSAGGQIVVNDEVSDGYWQGMTGGRVIGRPSRCLRTLRDPSESGMTLYGRAS